MRPATSPSRSVLQDYSAISVFGDLSDPLGDTCNLFKAPQGAVSPIDEYINNCKSLNMLWLSRENVEPELSRLLILGYVSAVESYFRAILRAVINSDRKSKSDAHKFTIPYGAAIYHKKHTIADALFEHQSFAGETEIRNGLQKFLGIKPDFSLKEVGYENFQTYEKICQMRHCCVHRFGKLGTQNGIALGLDKHKKVLENILVVNRNELELISSWLMSFVKRVNNIIFQELLRRTTDRKNECFIDWSWNIGKDRAKFNRIYKLFVTISDSAPSPSLDEMYLRFKSVFAPSRSLNGRIRSNP